MLDAASAIKFRFRDKIPPAVLARHPHVKIPRSASERGPLVKILKFLIQKVAVLYKPYRLKSRR